MASVAEIARKIFGSKNERELKRIRPLVDRINQLEPTYERMSDDEIRDLARRFRFEIFTDNDWARVQEQTARFTKAEWEPFKRKLEEILPDAFAAVREAGKRALQQRHFDVQLIGGIVLHQGKIAEMKTGEGKTLASTCPLFLNALLGRGVHVVTVNDYLARRDSEWMGGIYTRLGLTVGALQHDDDDLKRRELYRRDILYGTNSEFGFDYLRDNLKHRLEEMAQREPLYYAIVDEVDSILIDEARTPLIISGEVDRDSHSFGELKPAIERLVRKQKAVMKRLFREALEYGKLHSDDEDGYYFRLLQVERGDPKNAELLNLISESKEAKKKMERLHSNLRINKEAERLKAGLLYAMSEREHSLELTDEGQHELAGLIGDVFVLPELSTREAEIEADDKLAPPDKAAALEALHQEYQQKSEKLHNINQLLKAYTLFEIDDEYVVDAGKVVIVDEFTGRKMEGRRYSDGLHQALEAKEGLTIAKASQTIATITIQNYFRMYEKLAGMTGTADTEAEEFHKIYKLEVMVIPTHMPMVRDDAADVIYKTEKQKFQAVVEEIERINGLGQPILVGTTSVEKSERLHKMLKNRGVPHQILNAKHHEREAEIIAQAGRKSALTISTNMAGRGTDIILGGNPEMMAKHFADGDPEKYKQLLEHHRPICAAEHEEVVRLGGLHVLGTERHESRRIDNQLRGRSGRQGDPGSSRFFLSLEDDLMRIFGSDSLAKIMDRIGMEDNEPIEHGMVTRAIARAQSKVEANNFDIRKHLLEYDDVMNKQREIIYQLRKEALQDGSLRERILETIDGLAEQVVYEFGDEKTPEEEWDWKGLTARVGQQFGLFLDFNPEKLDSTHPDDLVKMTAEAARKNYGRKAELVGEEMIRRLEKDVYLYTIDTLWQDQLLDMDHLKEGIGLRGYGQRDPLLEYKREAFELFEELEYKINADSVQRLFRIQLTAPEAAPVRRRPLARPLQMGRGAGPAPLQSAADGGGPIQPAEARPVTIRREAPKVGRNDPCPCGSGKKYKKCCGA